MFKMLFWFVKPCLCTEIGKMADFSFRIMIFFSHSFIVFYYYALHSALVHADFLQRIFGLNRDASPFHKRILLWLEKKLFLYWSIYFDGNGRISYCLSIASVTNQAAMHITRVIILVYNHLISANKYFNNFNLFVPAVIFFSSSNLKYRNLACRRCALLLDK